jgi:cytoskeletal protein RodZ
MKRDTLKTLAGLLIIGVIVVATFMYGNAQRQAQIKRDEAAKKQQQAKANNDKALASASPSPTTQPTTGGTAAVQSPSSNNVQGGTQVTPTPSSSTKPPENGQVAGATAPTATPTQSAASDRSRDGWCSGWHGGARFGVHAAPVQEVVVQSRSLAPHVTRLSNTPFCKPPLGGLFRDLGRVYLTLKIG